MQEFVEFECPLLLLVVDEAPLLVFCNGDGHSLNNEQDIKLKIVKVSTYLRVLINVDIL